MSSPVPNATDYAPKRITDRIGWEHFRRSDQRSPEERAADEAIAILKVESEAQIAPPRSCTCHPDDNPPIPCPRKHAFSECKKAAPLDYMASLIRSLTYGEMIELAAGIWAVSEGNITAERLPGILWKWSNKNDA